MIAPWHPVRLWWWVCPTLPLYFPRLERLWREPETLQLLFADGGRSEIRRAVLLPDGQWFARFRIRRACTILAISFDAGWLETPRLVLAPQRSFEKGDAYDLKYRVNIVWHPQKLPAPRVSA